MFRGWVTVKLKLGLWGCHPCLTYAILKIVPIEVRISLLQDYKSSFRNILTPTTHYNAFGQGNNWEDSKQVDDTQDGEEDAEPAGRLPDGVVVVTHY